MKIVWSSMEMEEAMVGLACLHVCEPLKMNCMFQDPNLDPEGACYPLQSY